MKIKIGTIVTLSIILAVVLIGIFGFKSANAVKNNNQETENVIASGETKEFNIVAKNWEFNPSIIEVNKGDKVILNIKVFDTDHGFALPDFEVAQYLPYGEEIHIEFIADKTGEFPFFCNVYCGTGHSHMNGKLIVK